MSPIVRHARALLVGGCAVWTTNVQQAPLHPAAVHPAYDLACFAPIGGRSACADLMDVPPAERQMAACMLSVAKTVPKVKEPNLVVTANAKGRNPNGPAISVFIDYDYVFQSKYVFGPSKTRQDITQLIAPPGAKFLMLGLRGMTAHGTADELDDVNAGMMTLMNLWQEQCGLRASFMLS